MKVPRGTKISTSQNKMPQVAIEAVGNLTGYVRFSAASESLKDYFLFLKEGKVVGAYGEIEGEEELLGDNAKGKIFSTSSFDIVETFTLPLKVLDILFENYPDVALGFQSSSKKKTGEKVEEGSTFYRIGNIRVPILSPHKLFLKITSTDFFALLSDLRKERLSGFVRIFAESLDVVEEGCLFFLGGECGGAVYECGSKIRYGDEALLSIKSSFASSKGLIDVYSGDIAKILEKNEGVRISGSAESIIAARGEEEKKIHGTLFSEMGVASRSPAVSYPSDDIFSYQTLLKILSEKEFSGFLRIKNVDHGIITFSEGEMKGALLFGEEKVLSNRAYEHILGICEGECEIEVYPLEGNELAILLSRKELAFVGEEAKGDLEKYVMRELGEGSDIEVRRASAFKKQWENRRREQV